MKKLWVIGLLLMGTTSFSQIDKNVLFIGNSYTGVNNLPLLVSNLAASAGDNLNFDSHTPGGSTLNQHSTNPTVKTKIQQGGWDFVVLQEQSQIPSFPDSQVQSDCFPYADSLDSLINAYNPCGETMFYMTWGRQNGDANNCQFWPPVCTYEGMDSLLNLRYMQMANDNQAVVSPVGALWKYLRTNHPNLNLYASDGSHPSMAGSYAAACSFYATIFRKTPTLIMDDSGLSAADALIIRNAAKLIVFDSLINWNVGAYDPLADFSFTTNMMDVTFTNTSTNADNYLWDFGDGTTATNIDTVHTYTCNEHEVMLIAENCGMSDTIIQTVLLTDGNIPPCDLSINELAYQELVVFPNPVENTLILSAEFDKVCIVDGLGRSTEYDFELYNHQISMDLTSLEQGVYWVVGIRGENRFRGKFVKE